MTDDAASPNVPLSWKVLLGATIIDKRKLLAIQPEQHHDTVPRMRNTDEALRMFEEEQGQHLPGSLRGFLLHANGWDGVWSDLGLFGLAEFRGENNGHAAEVLLGRYADAGVLRHAGVTKAEVIAVGAGPPDQLVVTSWKTEETVWFSHGRIRERFEDFAVFFLELLNLHRDRLEERE